MNPYPARVQRTHTSRRCIGRISLRRELPQQPTEQPPTVTVVGRMIALRLMGKACFGHLVDGTGRLQFYLRQDEIGAERYEFFSNFDIGDFLAGQRLPLPHPHRRDHRPCPGLPCCSASRSCPCPRSGTACKETETRYRQRYLDLMANEESRAAVRHAQQGHCRHAPLPGRARLHRGGDAHPAAALWRRLRQPFTTHYNALDQTFYLRIATELYLKRLIVGGIEKVYEIGKNFRNEGIDTKHTPEFTVMESYEAYADYNDVMRMVEEMLRLSVRQSALARSCHPYGEHTIDFGPPWRRVTVHDAILEHAGIDIDQYPDQAEPAGAHASGQASRLTRTCPGASWWTS